MTAPTWREDPCGENYSSAPIGWPGAIPTFDWAFPEYPFFPCCPSRLRLNLSPCFAARRVANGCRCRRVRGIHSRPQGEAPQGHKQTETNIMSQPRHDTQPSVSISWTRVPAGTAGGPSGGPQQARVGGGGGVGSCRSRPGPWGRAVLYLRVDV